MPSKKPNPVPDPIVPPGITYGITHFHENNIGKDNLIFIARMKGVCDKHAKDIKYATRATICSEDETIWEEGWSFCSGKDVINKKKGIVEAVHNAVRKVNPNFYKERRFLLSGKNWAD